MASWLRSLTALPARYSTALILVVVLAVALGLRIYGIHWDQNGHFHPDERAVTDVAARIKLTLPISLTTLLDAKTSPLNPQWFNYGTFPIYVMRGVSALLANFDKSLGSYDGMYTVGRALSALFDVGTILLTFLLGRRLFSRRVGLLAAILVTFTVLHVQLSHFLTVDVALTFLIVGTVVGAARIMDRADLRGAALCGIFLGLAVASKVSVAPLLATVFVAALIYCLECKGEQPYAAAVTGRLNVERLGPAFRALMVATVLGGLFFFLGEPYAILDFGKFSANIAEQAAMVRRMADLPYTRQYIDTPPFIYHIWQTAVWGMGLPLGIAAWSGFVFSIYLAVRRRLKPDLLLLSWLVPYFALTGSFDVKFLRYMLPMTPFLAILAARLLLAAREELPRKGPRAEAPADLAAPTPVSLPWWAQAFQASQVSPSLPAQQMGSEALALAPAVAMERPDLLPRAWLEALRTRTELRQSIVRVAANLAIGVVLLSAVFYSLAYVNIYSVPHTANRAGKWLSANAPKGQTIAKEHWEEAIPGLAGYGFADLNLYEPDNPGKLQHIVDVLNRSNYVVFFSNRLYGTISRLPARYPLTTRYYQLLFSGQLGYELAHVETAYPNLLGITLVEDTLNRPGLPFPRALENYQPSPITLDAGFADESFSVYDHPKVLIFRKTQPLSANDLRALLAPALQNLPQGPDGRPVPGAAVRKEGLLLSPTDLAANRAGGTWAEIFNRDGLVNQFPLLAWLAMVEILSFVGLPLALWLFRPLRDRGYLFAKSLSILLVTYLAWLVASLHLLPYTRLTIVGAVAAVGILSTLVYFGREMDLIRTIQRHWRLWLVGEAVFLVAFLAFYLLRIHNPDLWHAWRGGEKPMDFAYLNAAIKTTFFPPYDPWFAGGYLNYYYFGQTIAATLTKLTGVIPSVAFNLLMPLFFALTLANAFSVAFNLAARAHGRAEAGGSGPTPMGTATGAGLAAGLFVAVFGNLDGLYQIVLGLLQVTSLKVQSGIPLLGEALGVLGGIWAVLTQGKSLPDFDFWRSSRMMPPTFNITEFPFFTFLFADPHAHLYGLPFTVLAIGLALALACWRTAAPPSLPSSEPGLGSAEERPEAAGQLGSEALVSPLRRLASSPIVRAIRSLGKRVVGVPEWGLLPLVVGLGITVGALRIINSWDFPAYLLLAAAALFISDYGRRARLDLRLVAVVGVGSVLLFALSTLLYLPFHRSFELFYTGIDLAQEKTPLWQYLSVHGLFLFAVLSYLAVCLHRDFGRLGLVRSIRVGLRYWDQLPRYLLLRQVLVRRADVGSTLAIMGFCLLLLLAGILIAIGWGLVAFLVVLTLLVGVLAIAELVRRRADFSSSLFVLAIVALAFGLGMGVDLVTIKGDVGRMNTVFKFYLQAWVLLGIAAAYAIWFLVRSASPRRLWWALLAFLVASCAIYPVMATPVRLKDRFGILPPTADGMAYMRSAVYREDQGQVRKGEIPLSHEYDALTWMQDHVEGSPAIVEAFTGLYRWGGRVSIYTGLPSVIGWDWHQTQQRSGYQWMIQERLNDLRTIYSSPDPAAALSLLNKYRVKYIYVGQLERFYYPDAGLAKFDQMVGRDLDLAYENPQVKIFQVRSARR